MTKNRLEAFSDGVLAIILTIMVLELKPPKSLDPATIWPLISTFIAYLLSFMNIGIYWGNHHHLVHGVKRVGAGIIWANMHLLFWLSLIPFATAWMGSSGYSPISVRAYGILLFLCGFAYDILRRSIDACHPDHSKLRQALNKQQIKGRISLVFYSAAIVCSFFATWLSQVLFFIVAIMWIIPDKNIERALRED